MNEHPRDPQLQENACMTLCLFHNPSELERFSKGIARALMSAAALFNAVHHTGSLPYIAHLMIGLSALPLRHKIAIGAFNTIEQLVAIIRRTVNNGNMQALGYAALWNITDSCAVNCERCAPGAGPLAAPTCPRQPDRLRRLHRPAQLARLGELCAGGERE
eukprot:Unigene108_Nuclearia_a/m.353 Unigene108_Nuclearia_a/g.353  ORF Unigene108_Nuclearia_a/g.353 Unigene108_Nuclearia_a/m.353 type:complete len:161 (+) Unigene108_Nuclearia_a:1309-1791(+)